MRPSGRSADVVDTAKFDYGKAAVIAYNMQKINDGENMPMRKIISNVGKLIDAAHEKGLPVFYGRHMSLPPSYMSEYYAYWQRELGEDLDAYYRRYSEGAIGTEIIDAIKPTDKDIVIRKYNASFFIGTNVEILLHNRGVRTLILSGVGTEHGIDSTARHATFLGFMPVIAEDAVVGKVDRYADYSLELMRGVFHCDIQKTDYIVNRIKSGK
jgi:nicotinamidase-related amidase